MGEPHQNLGGLMELLAAPFAAGEVKWKPTVVNGNRALAVAYVDVRVIQDRLDEVVGVSGWQDDYEFLPDGAVLCRLRLRLADEWITKADVGGQSEQPDEGDRQKAAVSDALKRAAVKFGIGRYLYRLPPQWFDYDPKKKRLAGTPSMESSAVSARPKPAAALARPAPAAGGKQAPPTNGAELKALCTQLENSWVMKGLYARGQFMAEMYRWAREEWGTESVMERWPADVVAAAPAHIKDTAARLKEQATAEAN